jgi:LCP family protein required for cell wall assembly
MRSGLDYLDHPDVDQEPEAPPGQSRTWKIIGWASVVLSAILVITSLGLYGVYYDVVANSLQHEKDPNAGDKVKAPPKLNSSVNILIMGSDTREGANKKYGRDEGSERSDTTILLHLSAGGKQAMGISFPRDSMVNIPQCKDSSGRVHPANFGMINSAFAAAGPYCTMRTIESLTQINIDHFVKVDFTGFKAMVNALGGVKICAPKAFSDPLAKLVIKKAGPQIINGDTALGWVRTRHALGDGGDVGRIQRQQQFMSSVIQKATSSGVLTNPTKLLGFVKATTKSLKTDEGFSVSTMVDLAGKLKGIDLKKVNFVTVPWRYATIAERAAHPDWAGRLFWQEDKAQALFSAVAHDNKPPKAEPAPTAKPTAAVAKVAPAKVNVKVFNGTMRSGLAGTTVNELKAKKYVATLGSTATYKNGTLTKTAIQYGVGGEGAAAQLATLFPGTTPVASTQVAQGQVALYLGADYTALGSAAGSTGLATTPKIDDTVNAGEKNLCKDNSAA